MLEIDRGHREMFLPRAGRVDFGGRGAPDEPGGRVLLTERFERLSASQSVGGTECQDEVGLSIEGLSHDRVPLPRGPAALFDSHTLPLSDARCRGAYPARTSVRHRITSSSSENRGAV